MTAGQTAPLSAVDAAKGRVSIRKYIPNSVSRAELEALLGTVIQAPSAFNVQPWRFVVVQDQALKDQLWEAAYRQPQVKGAPAVIVLYTDMSDVMKNLDEIVHPGLDAEKRAGVLEMVRGAYGGMSDEARETFGAGQGGIALGYLLLTAASMGFGTSPMLGFDPAKVKEVLGLPAHVQIPAMIAIGRPDESGYPRHRHALGRVVSFR